VKKIFSDSDFVNLMNAHSKEVIKLLQSKGMFFSILVNIKEVEFDPELPDYIKGNFKPITLFALAGYTYETIEIDDEFLEFEAGFGSENIGSIVKVPLHSIIQLLLDDTPIYINLSRKVNKQKQESKIERSKNIFLANPENRKYIKK
jgi:hypothetical protein